MKKAIIMEIDHEPTSALESTDHRVFFKCKRKKKKKTLFEIAHKSIFASNAKGNRKTYTKIHIHTPLYKKKLGQFIDLFFRTYNFALSFTSSGLRVFMNVRVSRIVSLIGLGANPKSLLAPVLEMLQK